MSSLANPEILIQLCSLLGMASFCVYVGSKRSLRKENEEDESETITSNDALGFPLFASGALFSIYILYKYLDSWWLMVSLTAYFALVGTFGVQFAIVPPLVRILSPYYKILGDKIIISIQDGQKNPASLLEFSRADIIGIVLGGAIATVYVITKHWIATNIISMSIVIGAMQVLKLDNFKVACILLTGLLLYDIFWVFGTDVMVTVSKQVDGPIKILFPSDILTGGFTSTKLGMLGLGDIMIPGIVVALMYRFDISRGGGRRDAPTPYFNAAWVAYMLGLILTFLILHVFQHPQPALLYLSPIGILTPLCQATLRGEVKELFEYCEAKNEGEESSGHQKKEE